MDGAAGVSMNPNELDVSAIAPRNGEKYSPNLYKYLTGREIRHITARYARVYVDANGTKWLGYIDEEGGFCGAKLVGVLCNGRKEVTGYYGRQLGVLNELSEFWSNYLRDGRCAIDVEHEMFFVGDGSRWRVTGDERECLWCGKARQRRERYIRTTEHERWVNNHPILSATSCID